MANKEWKEVFSASRVTHMKPSRSDHVPLGIEILTTRVIRRVKRKRFHIEEFWLRDAECIDVVRNGRVQYSGGDLFQAVCRKIDRTRRALWDWSNRKFGSLKKEIEKTRGRLAVYYDRARPGWSDQERVQLEKRLNELMEHEHNYWKQRARIMWLTEGDLNTRYFHQKADNRRRRNEIKGCSMRRGCGVQLRLKCKILFYITMGSCSLPVTLEMLISSRVCSLRWFRKI